MANKFSKGDKVKCVSLTLAMYDDQKHMYDTVAEKFENYSIKLGSIITVKNQDNDISIDLDLEDGHSYPSDCFELAQDPAIATTVVTEPVLVTAANAVVGMKVVRGRDWDWNNQDKNTVGEITETRTRWVTVTWAHGIAYGYRIGDNEKFDLYVYQEPTTTTVTANQSKTPVMITVKKSLITAGYSAATGSLASKIKTKFTNVDLFADTVQVEEDFIRECHDLACADWKIKLEAEFPTLFKPADPVQELIDKLGITYGTGSQKGLPAKYSKGGKNYVRVFLPDLSKNWTFACYDWVKKFVEEYNKTGNCRPTADSDLESNYLYILINQ